jgi:hypothetical protein
MKYIYILLLFSVLLSNIFGQGTLTFLNNGLLPGDSSRTVEINYIDPGSAGENQVWDFSGIQYTGKNSPWAVTADDSQKRTVTSDKNIILCEEGYNYQYLSGETSLVETGYVNAGKKMTLNYSDAVVRMKYPFAYGQSFSDPFSGVAWFNETSRIDLSGEFIVTADAFGTLILPDRILKNTLRVKSSRQSLQIGVCGSTQSNTDKYFWYAPGYRYPVLMVCITANSHSGKEPVYVKSAWVNLNQQAAGSVATGSDPNSQVGTVENSVIVFPNPFNEQLTYNYFLRKQLTVTVELFDMSGKFNLRVEKKQLQSEGLHTGTINAPAIGLPPGVYYLRFTLDKQVVVTKIVKVT